MPNCFRRWRPLLPGLVAALILPIAQPAFAASSAVVFMYHRFGETTHPSTNTTIAHAKRLAASALTSV